MPHPHLLGVCKAARIYAMTKRIVGAILVTSPFVAISIALWHRHGPWVAVGSYVGLLLFAAAILFGCRLLTK